MINEVSRPHPSGVMLVVGTGTPQEFVNTTVLNKEVLVQQDILTPGARRTK